MRFYIGTYTGMGGAGACVAEAVDGSVRVISTCDKIGNPNYLIKSKDGQTIYASASIGDDRKGAVAAYRLSGDELIPLSVQPTDGGDACHVALSADERHLYSANYAAGSVSVFPVKDGYIMPRIQTVKHGAGSNVFPGRQEAAHTHHCAFRPNSNQLFVCDLGMDEIKIYLRDEDEGTISETAAIKAAAGCGPRHILFDGENRFMLACELSNEIKLYDFVNDAWECRQTLATLPDGCETENTVAAIRRFGGRVFVSNRGYDSVAAFVFGEDGLLKKDGLIRVSGNFPRDILPFGENDLLTANQFGGTIELIKDGITKATAPMKGAVCLLEA